jgi:WD40 repeat protein/tRNA A-37 threonylcarbamoyl transferase component Bud32
LTPERWREVESLFELVVDLSATERGVRLDSACADDRELRVEVESLVAAIQGAPTRIQEVIGQQAEDLAAPPEIGQQLGRYRMLEKLGEGGMGVVFLAERVDGEYRTKVAIKLLRGLESRDAIARFRDERQILATLEHPGIVRLLDGGSTDSGQPYLVMEYVAGLPISDYVAAQRLSLVDRLELFNRVASAVAFAHQRLVVHRDLKPSNILVTQDGTPKLLDFGIAKLLAGESQREASTRTGMQLLTPEYASPEQVRGQPISTATDVYSLGAVLYELCTEAKAQQVTGESIERVLRAILDTEPARPSTVATPGWRRALRGDLDNIILKALHKQPDKRYASVEQLIEDIERHLDGLPVKARAATLSYRAGKFVRRNVVSVVAASIVLGTLISATLVSLAQARRADEQAADAEQARQLAETQASLAREQAAVARARARTTRDALRIGAAQQAVEDPTLAMLLLREVESMGPEPMFGWLRAVPHFHAPSFVTTTLLGGGSTQRTLAVWSPDGTRIAAAWPQQPVQVWTAEGTLLTTLAGEQGRAIDIAWSPDGTHLVTASHESIARVWRADGTALAVLEGHAPLGGTGMHVAWNPDGTRISTAATDKTVRSWAVDGSLLATLEGFPSGEIWASWSPDGSRLLTGSPWDSRVRVWRSDGTLSTTFEGHGEGIVSAAWSPDGATIVTGSTDATARVWRVDDAKLLAVLEGHEGRIEALAWSPDGSRIALGSTDDTASVWRAEGTRVATLAGHQAAVIDVQWSPDGRWIATASEDRTARVWQSDGVQVGTLVGHRLALQAVSWRPHATAQLLTTAEDGTVRIWQPEANLPSVLASHADGVLAAAWSPDGTKFATASEDHTARVWQRDSVLLATLVGHDDSVRSVAWSPDGDWLLTTSEDHTARVWRVDGTLHATLGGGPDEVLAASWGASLLATAHADGTARVWRSDGTLQAVLTGHTDAVRSVTWSSSGRQLLTSSWDSTARVWETDGTLRATLVGHEQAVQIAAWSPDGTHIATASMDRSARIWRSDGTLVAVLEGQSEMESVTWRPDGSRLVTSSMDHVAQIWRADGAPIARLVGHEGEITSVVWSRDGTRILTTSGNGIDGAARLWNEDGHLLATLPHDSAIPSGAFDPAGTHVLTAARDGRVRVWLVDAAQLLRGFWLSTPRCLDAFERQRVLAETRADADFGAGECRAMHECLRDEAGAAVPERFESCLAESRVRRDAHYL